MRVKISDNALERVAKKIKGQYEDDEIDRLLGDDEVSLEMAREIAQEAYYQILDVYGPEDQNAAMAVAREIFLDIGGKTAQSPPKWSDEEDETFEMDEAHQEFMQIDKLIESFANKVNTTIPEESLSMAWGHIVQTIIQRYAE